MVRTDSIQFDVDEAKERAELKGWELTEWAKRADVSMPTLREFLKGNPVKIRTVDDIVRPLGLTAAALIKK